MAAAELSKFFLSFKNHERDDESDLTAMESRSTSKNSSILQINGLENHYRKGFHRNGNDRKFEETYPIGRFRNFLYTYLTPCIALFGERE